MKTVSNYFILLVVFFCSCNVERQTAEARHLFWTEKNYQKSIPIYKKIARKVYAKEIYYYRLATAYDQLDDSLNTYKYLKKAFDFRFSTYEEYRKDTVFFKTFRTQRLAKALAVVYDERLKKVDKKLKRSIDSLLVEDQRYRKYGDSLLTYYSKDVAGFNRVFKDSLLGGLQKKIDLKNQIFVDSIVNLYGWLSFEQVGESGTTGLWAIAQHADLKYQKKCLPYVKKAAKEGKILYKNYAFLQDRVLVRQKKKQIYGTQYHINEGKSELAATKRMKKLDNRRLKVGLGPLKPLKW
jgi:transposase-like protein